MRLSKSLLFIFLSLFVGSELYSQCQFDEETGILSDARDGGPCNNSLGTALPFLLITPDARAGAMGDIGVATSADPNKMHHNQSMLAFADQPLSFSATYTPWLADLGLNDIYLGYFSGYYKPDDLQAIGFGLRYFSYGTINFTDIAGTAIGTGKPYELELNMAYARKLSERFSAAIGGKYLYSNLAAGQQIGQDLISAGTSIAADVSFTYTAPLNFSSAEYSDLTLGLAIKNIGSKINYTDVVGRDSNIPTSLNIGAAWNIEMDDFNQFTLAMELHKLLVPTPIPTKDHPEFDVDEDGIPDYRQKSVIGGMFSSFGDAPGGFSEELREVVWQLGAEYWYNNQFAVRAGYFHESQTKGNRQYLTLGAGIKYNVFGLNFSYLLSTAGQNNPLNNTFRFSLIFDINALAYDEQ